jgi:hypothetical protein
MQNDLSRAEDLIKSKLQEAGDVISAKLIKDALNTVSLIESILPCKYCSKLPHLSDVGGNNAYYEIGCKCKDGMVVGSHDRAETITTWNILNERK